MNQDKLNHLIQEASSLSNIEKVLLIKSLTQQDERPLTEKEKEFIKESEKNINELQDIRVQLKKVIEKLE